MKLTLPDSPPDWTDQFEGPIAPPNETARTAAYRAIAALPGWATPLMSLRNRLARLVGLHGEGNDPSFLARMPVVTDTPEQFESGLTDRHLTFTLRADLKGDHLTLSTRIWFNHPLGRVYLAAILPFHNAMLRHVMRQLARPQDTTTHD